MKKCFFWLTLFVFYTSCAMDYSCSAEIVNEAPVAINLSIKYNQQKLEEAYNHQRQSYLHYLTAFNESSNLPFSFDTVNLKLEYTLPAQKRIRVDRNVGGQGVSPNYLFIEEIEIKIKDKDFIYKRPSFDSLFKKRDVATWEFVID